MFSAEALIWRALVESVGRVEVRNSGKIRQREWVFVSPARFRRSRRTKLYGGHFVQHLCVKCGATKPEDNVRRLTG